jgi:CO/xanthine dehydrogenase Mo-binding subunit
MRGFGVTAMDFALECQMDKLAHLVGIDRWSSHLNAYRDGDMKAHRREAKNTALIECVRSPRKAKWPLREVSGCRRARMAAAPGDHITDAARAAPQRAAVSQQRTTYDRAPPATISHRRPRRRPSPRHNAVAAAWRCPFLFRLRHQEADKTSRGRGIASINYPIGMNWRRPQPGAGSFNPSGKFTVSLSSIDLGQGMKSVTRQICAETLGVPWKTSVDTADPTPAALHGLVRLARHASRRQRVMAAARGARCHDGRQPRNSSQRRRSRYRRARQYPRRARRTLDLDQDVAIAAQFKQGKTISTRHLSGAVRGRSRPARCRLPPATPPAWSPRSRSTTRPARSRWCAWTARELGRALNPAGRAAARRRRMDGVSRTFETPEPYYRSAWPARLVEYLMPGPGDICPHDIAVLERPRPMDRSARKDPERCA